MFLDVCLDYWDPIYDVFVFRNRETCLLPEAFVVIWGWSVDAIPTIPPLHLGYKNLYRDFVGISKDKVELMVKGDKVELLRIIVKFTNPNNTTIPYAAHWYAFFFVYFLDIYFLAASRRALWWVMVNCWE